MVDVLRIKRRAVGGAAGAPASLAAAEIAYNEQDDKLYYGKGNSGGVATSIIPIAGPGTFVRHDAAQSLSAVAQEQARRNMYAAPFDAMAFHNLLPNGSFMIQQEVPSGAVSVSGAGGNAYIADLWVLSSSVSGLAISTSVQNGLGTIGLGSAIFLNCTAGAAPPAANFSMIQTAIEGDRCTKLWWGTSLAAPITITFYVYANFTGIVPVSIRNSAFDRSYVVGLSVTNGIWELKSITIPGDTSGTWLKDQNTVGLRISFGLCVGSNFDAPSLNTWSAGNYISHSSRTNFGTSGNQMYIGGMSVVQGNTVPTAAQFPMLLRSFTDELALVKRYWQKSYNNDVVPGTVTNVGQYVGTTPATGTSTAESVPVRFGVQMRAAPTVTVYHAGTGAAGQIQLYSPTSGGVQTVTATVNNVGHQSFQIAPSGAAGLTNGAACEIWGQYVANARLV